jgi:exodeoxyribonuclease V alpha subunit
MPWSEQFRHHAGNPLPHDVIIVDEASMVDVLMMDRLFAAARPEARIIVLGDPDQLASVDTGFVLGDVARAAAAGGRDGGDAHGAALADDYARLSGGKAAWLKPHAPVNAQGNAPAGALRDAVVRLRVSYRFGARPGIGALATAVQEGDPERALDVLADSSYPDVTHDAWPVVRSPAVAAHMQVATMLLAPLLPQVEAFLETHDPGEALAALSQFRVLCALRDGDRGVTGLNAIIEAWLRERGVAVEGCYDHRPILITANDAGLQLFNGDVGVVLTAGESPLVHFAAPGGGVRALPPNRLPAHETAWAMTVHKSQGSEFDHVHLVLPDTDTRILTRELIYTGITRAKASVAISGPAELLVAAIGRSVRRASGLQARIDH